MKNGTSVPFFICPSSTATVCEETNKQEDGLEKLLRQIRPEGECVQKVYCSCKEKVLEGGQPKDRKHPFLRMGVFCLSKQISLLAAAVRGGAL